MAHRSHGGPLKREAAALSLLQDLAAGPRGRRSFCQPAGEGTAALGSHPYQAILGTAERERCDLIVLGSHHGTGPVSMMLESETMRVLSHTRIPVLIYRTNS
jgi:nucleotide-binding universal stress UspA family protein